MISVRSFGASSAHEGLWRAQEMFPDTLNHALTLWNVDGELDASIMEAAFLRVMDEAEVLRVNFVDDGSGLRLVPRELGDWRPFFLDLSAEDDPERAARKAVAEVLRQPFNLERDLLFRLGVVKLAQARSVLVIIYHHLISDGYGASGLLSRRFAEVYTALAQGSDVAELPHPWDVESFTTTAAEYRTSEQFTEDTAFWRDYLTDAPAPAQVPRVALSEEVRSALDEPMNSADRWGHLTESIGMVSRTLTVPRIDVDAWSEAAKSMGVWMSSMLTAAAAVYLRHRCDRQEFLLSLAVANRGGVASRTPGLAVNVVPVRVNVPLGATFTDIADAIGDETYEIFDHATHHYSEIQRASGTVLNDRGSFGAVVNIVEFPEHLQFDGSPARFLGGTTGTFEELAIAVYTDGSTDRDLFIRLDAPAGLYSRAELRFIGEDLIAHIHAVVSADDEQRVGALDVVSGVERDRVLTAPNNTEVAVPGLTVPELFARQVVRAPDAVAVVSDGMVVSYRDVDERSSRLARALQRQEVGPETVVAVALPRSVDLIVAVLGVVKAGGAYLTVDPAEPVTSVARDASVRVLLTDRATAVPFTGEREVRTVLFDDIQSEVADDDGAVEVPVRSHRDGLLAVMHGTGPTGAATGVALTHRNMERFVLDRRWREGGEGAVLWHAPSTYDALPLDVWVPLLNGGRVVVAPSGELDVDTLAEVQAVHGISRVWLSAHSFSAIAAGRPKALAGLREVWTGGDRVSVAAVRRVREACPELTVVSGHGPTESTVFAASHRLAADEPLHHTDTVGRPMDNTALYVLGPGLAPTPVGVAGELYVAGPGVARGYPGRPGATAERFVPCPFGPIGGLMYRTGDRVRRAAEGSIEYVGRADARTEVRGVRVEPAEVEAVLSEHPGLAQVVVAAKENDSGQRRLAAFVVPAGGSDPQAGPSDGDLRRFATGRLPEIMVPSAFVVLERLPLTLGGRLDSASLPNPVFDDRQHRAPRDRTERVLAEAFAEVLELDRVVGVDEDFFDLGGNSLRAIRLVGLIRAGLSQEVSIRTLFTARTIAGLSGMWKDLAQSSRPALRRRTKNGEVL
ncbi:AMP-binding protein [Streptomyces sp. NPDC005963]|uniref:non-ribosomal peptide synthetase n=1 Tax=Streptomyces sp. NPDC005963 TaxID=3156721 RepID=UPI003402CC42